MLAAPVFGVQLPENSIKYNSYLIGECYELFFCKVLHCESTLLIVCIELISGFLVIGPIIAISGPQNYQFLGVASLLS